ncbi:MAG: alpha/beta hydrolase family protein [Alphaproteobacteria bacterium]|jgi:predicted dienelactone hydrolase|nr:alpha/beta fold hydrolase [Candidatus Jidaibacter sp.]
MSHRCLAVIIGLILSFVHQEIYAAVGTEEITFLSQSSGRNIVAEIYYPGTCKIDNKQVKHGIWLRENYLKAKCDIDDTKKYPLILFSHGFQGDRFGNSWFAEGLVSQGYIVAMVDHASNTSYESSDLFVYTSMWQRPIDISELLTYMLQDSKWNKVVDEEKIAVSGFSLGGTTALWLSGIKSDKDKFHHVMDAKYSRWDDWPEYAKSQARLVDWSKAENSYKDERVKAVVSIAPDLGEAFSINGLTKADVPVLIVIGDKDVVTPKKHNADFYAQHIPKAKLFVIKDAEHFTFMNKCSAIGFKVTPHLCDTDVKKDNAHDLVINKTHDFLLQVLK